MKRSRGRERIPKTVKPRLLIICEGKCTEPYYFEGFRRTHRNVIIKVYESPGKTPRQIVSHSLERMREMDIGKVNGDAAWCVFDVDDCTDDELHKAVELAGSKMFLAVSNPCFELWFLLHYTFTENWMDSCSDVVSELRRYIPRYEKSMDLFERLQPALPMAVSNADRLERRRNGLGFGPHVRGGNPCTSVHLLVQSILDSV
ncbi:MAG TPA: RloB family protein [Methanomassiliicoccales archaeon]|nr:RloB family protein [Methanomassiliicoccales archaeon]